MHKAIAKSGLIYESKKLYENQVSDWIRRVLSGKKYQIELKAAQMLVEFLGTDLSKISNELDKLMLICKIRLRDRFMVRMKGRLLECRRWCSKCRGK